MSLYDCCREIPPTKSSKNAMKSSTDTQNMGMSHSFYAKQDGELASAGSKDDDLSPTTSSWIYFMKANPGACYPLILGEF